MNNREANFEKNLKRLLKASCGPEVAVTPAVRERLRAALTLMLHRRLQPAEFPESILGAITALVLLVFIVCAWPGATTLARGVPGGPILALLIVNLVGIPFASLVIILRRKYARMEA